MTAPLRYFIAAGDKPATLLFAAEDWIHRAEKAILEKGAFYVALSGGSTPKAIFEILSGQFAKAIDWQKVHLYWSDERAVAPTSPDSNYKMAMDAGFNKLPIPKDQIIRMEGEHDLQQAAAGYERTIREQVPDASFDLVMLGMGEDGHTASLFPNTRALNETKRLVVANEVPELNTWRLTFTFPCINRAKQAIVYVLGASKAYRIQEVFNLSERVYPVQEVGTKERPALFILDQESASHVHAGD